MKVLLLGAILLGCNISASSGSTINFNASTQTIDPMNTKNLTIRCALNDSPSGVNKRSAPAHEISARQHGVMKRSPSGAVEHVKSTPKNVLSVTAIIISRDGKDLAQQVINSQAVRKGSDNRYTVTGKMSHDGENYVELVWPHPTGKDAGEFKCDIATISAEGRSLVFSDHVTVEDSAISNQKLIEHVNDLQAELQELKSQMTPKVFFSAALSLTTNYKDNDVVKYDHVTANEGGAYDASTGTFTAPVTGFYRFQVSATSWAREKLKLGLNKNGVMFFQVFTIGKSTYPSATNAGILKLLKGDKVIVTAATNNINLDNVNRNIFSGQLIALA